ncbi:MAG: diaminopimelate epimerase [Acidimicrobiales bacterium]
MSEGGSLRLVKYEGAGNDFLVLIDPDGEQSVGDAEVRNLCDRRRGVGADGFIQVVRGTDGADLIMELRNADGGRAETSGNGLRCVAQAAVETGLASPPRFVVRTADQLIQVEYQQGGAAGSAQATVQFPPVRLLGSFSDGPTGFHVYRADTGNPHLVVICEDPADMDVGTIGPNLALASPTGANVEFVARGPGVGELTMRVWERGAGETWACGSGSCAAAAVARSLGMVGDRVLVRNPGGTLEVVFGAGDEDPVYLSGPMRRVADVIVDRNVIA